MWRSSWATSSTSRSEAHCNFVLQAGGRRFESAPLHKCPRELALFKPHL
jgi:hypothetical protein